MIRLLRVLFAVAFVVIATTVVRACLDTALWEIPAAVTGDVWFRATLVDIYIAFLTFYVWVAWKERSWAARVLWLLAIVSLGSIAVTAYCLRELWRVPADATMADVLLRRSETR